MNTRKLTSIAAIAGLYTALTFVFAGISYGPVQFRIGEALAVLPIFGVIPVHGVTLGCFISNLIGLFLGFAGTSVFDLAIGPIATFLAAKSCYYIGKTNNKVLIYVFAGLPPVLINGILIGLELTFLCHLGEVFIVNCLMVALGEFVVCYGLGLFLIYIFFRNDLYKKLFY